MSQDFDRTALVQIFVAESTDGLTRLAAALGPPDGGSPDPRALQAEAIVAHTLCGAAALYGYAGLAQMADRLETLLRDAEQVAPEDWPDQVAEMRELVGLLQRQVEAIARTGAEEPAGSPPAAEPSGAGPAAGSGEDSVSDAYLLPELDAEVFSYFAPEAAEYLEAIEAALLCLERQPDDPNTIQALFRTAHTLKGAAFTVGFEAVGDLTHLVEDLLGAVREGRAAMSGALADATLRMVDVVRLLLRRDPRQLDELRTQFMDVRAALRRLRAPEPSPEFPSSSSTDADSSSESSDEAVEPARNAATDARGQEGEPGRATDDASVIRVSRDRLERLLNLVGELVISRGRLEQRLLTLEQVGHQVLLYKSRMLESVRGFEERHGFTYVPTLGAGPGDAGTASGGDRRVNLADFGGLEFDKYDDYNIFARQMAELSADVTESMAQLSGSIRQAREDMTEVQRLTLAMRDEIARARMVPIGTPFTRFRRAVREMAKTSGKDVTLTLSGEATEVDTLLVERLVDPLIHLVRNAVVHGIEPPSIRLARGKPATGHIALRASHRSHAVVVEVEDDGAGLDLPRIKSKAVDLGLIRADQAEGLSEAEIARLIFLHGFSTAEGTDEQAGRGVGLDVVQRTVEAMNGQIDVETEPGAGTKFTLTLPFTLLISMALIVRVGSERFAVPLPAVREVLVPPADAIQDVGGRPMLQLDAEAVEVRPLSQLLGVAPEGEAPPCPIVVVRTAGGLFGLEVDELLGRQEIVIKGLGGLKSLRESCFSGATIDPDGRVILVLDVARLLVDRPNSLHKAPTAVPLLSGDGSGHSVASPGMRPEDVRLLLIDDSLSVRKFVGRMLERAGFRVDTAVDGEEGLRLAAEHDYGLIMTDLEMPKLNGYEVIQALRQRPRCREIPILVMTTRAGEKHRRLALDVGASGYIAKPVEERALVREVERWLTVGRRQKGA